MRETGRRLVTPAVAALAVLAFAGPASAGTPATTGERAVAPAVAQDDGGTLEQLLGEVGQVLDNLLSGLISSGDDNSGDDESDEQTEAGSAGTEGEQADAGDDDESDDLDLPEDEDDESETDDDGEDDD